MENSRLRIGYRNRYEEKKKTQITHLVVTRDGLSIFWKKKILQKEKLSNAGEWEAERY